MKKVKESSFEYDESRDFIRYRTLSMIPKSDAEQYLASRAQQETGGKKVNDEMIQEKFVQEDDKKRKQMLLKLLLVLLCMRFIVSLFTNMTYSTAQTVSDITLYIGVAAMLIAEAAVLILVIRLVQKRPVKKIMYLIAICAVVFVICVVIGRHSLSVVNYYEMICENGVLMDCIDL